MTIKECKIKSEYMRKYPDPLNKEDLGKYNITHHIILMKAIDLPKGMPKDPNPREQKIDWGIYKDVKNSLTKDDSSFHLKNKGLTILADKVDYNKDKTEASVFFSEGQGIVDGGHTYEIILSSNNEGTTPEDQYVKLEILTNVPIDMYVDITGGLNTAVQVQKSSLANLKNEFDWIKNTLKCKDYSDKIAYKENEQDKSFDIRDIISFMTLFNIDDYGDGTEKHPKVAYTSKAKCLDEYLSKIDSFKKMKYILPDILELSDFIHYRSADLYNKDCNKNGRKGRAAGMKGVFETRKRGKFQLVFINEENENKLYDGTLFPVLGAFRFLIKEENGYYKWKLESFSEVKDFFEKIAPKLITTTYNTSIAYGRKPTSIGKDDNLWNSLYQTVAIEYLRTNK